MGKSTAEIRQTFLDFFHKKGHQIVPGSSLVPHNDPTLLFTNAGMHQFKDVFLGLEKRNYSRAVTSQYCVRAGGKHNDLENVGYTVCHHTFFEMVGNFSFGDYFKREAIYYAWELLTDGNWFNLSRERLWITVYKADKETYEIWKKEIGIPNNRIICIGDKKNTLYQSDNFWQMGNTGPCGPCTEIFYDHGDHIKGGPPGSTEIGNRYIEIWNIVFMQFNRQIDGTMELLPKPSVDTGMGLERISAALQNVHSNYDIDLFRMLIQSIADIIGATDLNNRSLRVIADHIRSCAFLVADGIVPSNEKRGYALRRIIRRAIRHGNMLGMKDSFFYKLVSPLIEVMDASNKNLKHQQVQVEQVLKIEEEQFIYTLERGLVLLDQELAKLKSNTLNGEIAFRLYDTYGFPIDLTLDICQERNIKVDMLGFESVMEKQRYRARKTSNFNIDYNTLIKIDCISEFQGYNYLELNSKVIAIFVNGKLVNSINVGQKAVVILDNTPFFAESGGQVGDKGKLKGYDSIFIVNDTQKYGQAIGHVGDLLSGSLKIGDNISALVDMERRVRIQLNHSATHLLHAALRIVLGLHVLQKGSLVNDKYLRFDFSHCRAMKSTEIRTVENLVNMQIRRNLLIKTNIMDLDEAKAKGAMAIFVEKYAKRVRVLSIGDFSTEICVGTHASYTGEIGLFRIISEFGTATGVRRIEAVTGENSIADLHAQSDKLHRIAQLLKSDNHNLDNKLRSILGRTRQLEKELKQLKEQIVVQESTRLSKKFIKIKETKLIVSNLSCLNPKILRTIVDNLKNQLGSAVIVLATINEGEIFLIAGVSKDIIERVKAEELINMIAIQVGGKGGGRSDMAQAGGGKDIKALPVALASIRQWVSKKL